MKIPTPILINELQAPVKKGMWDGKITAEESKRIEKIMQEAAIQLEWFFNNFDKERKKT